MTHCSSKTNDISQFCHTQSACHLNNICSFPAGFSTSVHMITEHTHTLCGLRSEQHTVYLTGRGPGQWRATNSAGKLLSFSTSSWRKPLSHTHTHTLLASAARNEASVFLPQFYGRTVQALILSLHKVSVHW